MINLPSENPWEGTASKYSLVIAVAKRARQITAAREPGVVLAHKPVIIAMEEIETGKVRVVARPEPEDVNENSPESAKEEGTGGDPPPEA